MSRNLKPRMLCHDGHTRAAHLSRAEDCRSEGPVEPWMEQLADELHELARLLREAKAAGRQEP